MKTVFKIRVFNADEYAGYGNTNRLDTLSGETIATVTMYLEYLTTPGKDSFRLTDPGLFYDLNYPERRVDTVIIDTLGQQDRHRSNNANRGNYYVMPQYWNACFNISLNGNNHSRTGRSATLTTEMFCIEVTEWVEIIDDWPSMYIPYPIEGGGGGGDLGQSICQTFPGGQCTFVPGIGWVPLGSGPTNSLGYYYTKIDTLLHILDTSSTFLINPCDQLNAFYTLGNFQAPSSVTNRLDSINNAYRMNPNYPHIYRNFLQTPYYIQNINNASGTVVNCDYFSVHISTLPTVNGTQWTAQQLMDYFRLHMNLFVVSSVANFSAYHDGFLNDINLWNSSNPLTALVHINMFDDGTVIVSQHFSYADSAGFLVKTLKSPMDNTHPVSGNRTWRIEPDHDNGGYTFYTRAVDRVTTNLANLVNNITNWGFSAQDDLWESLQDKMAYFVNSNGGSASVNTPGIARIKWNDLRDYLLGNKTLAELRAAYGCP